jgi:hypothetical protein
MFTVIYEWSALMKKIVTTDDILNDRTIISQERADKIRANVEKEVAKVKAKNKPIQKKDSKGQ